MTMVNNRLFIILGCIALIYADCSRDAGYVLSSNTFLRKLMHEKYKYNIQIRYTQIDRDKNGLPKFTPFDFNVNANQYFYPASTVKMPVAFLALQRLNEISNTLKKDISHDVQIKNFAAESPQTDCTFDSTAMSIPTIKNYIIETFVVSDNNAYNRLFEFLGPEYINNSLKSMKIFTNSEIFHRVGVAGFNKTNQSYTNKIELWDGDKMIYSQDPKKREYIYNQTNKTLFQGKGYINQEGELINEPFDFTSKNIFTIIDLEECIKRVLFPEAYTEPERFLLKKEDYTLLYRAMRSLPRDISYYQQDTSLYDTYVKYYLGDKGDAIPDNIKVLNKVGMAYGFLTDCSYIFDINSGMEFLLTATIRVNEDNIFNDNAYEYNEIGFPFFEELGKEIMKYDAKRERKYKANFKKYLQ